MAAPPLTPEQKKLSDGIAAWAHSNIEQLFKVNGLTAQSLIGATRATLLAIDENVEGLLKNIPENHEIRPQCAKFCAACCFQSFDVHITEVFAIFALIKEKHTPDDLNKLHAVLRDRQTRVKDLDRIERQLQKIPCAFLAEGLCRIYAIRPQNCRTHFSASRRLCDQSLEVPTDNVPLFVEPKIIGQGSLRALDRYLAQRGVVTGRIDFITGLLTIWRDDTALERWLNGEDVFGEFLVR